MLNVSINLCLFNIVIRRKTILVLFGSQKEMNLGSELMSNKIRDLFKVKLYTIRSEAKKEGERERRERETYVNPSTDRGGHK